MPDFLFDGPPGGTPVIVLAHGAGAPMDSPFMRIAAEGLGARGRRVARFEFPYMQARRTSGRRGAPDRPAVLLQAWREAVDALGGGAAVVIGGKSMGGRIASMVADECAVRSLICLGYPFHAPGRAAGSRVEHLAAMTTPALILQGTRDSFGSREDVAGYSLSPAIRVHWLDGADHDFRTPGSRAHPTSALTEAIEAVATFVKGAAW